MPKTLDIMLMVITIVVLCVFAYFAADALQDQKQVISRQNNIMASQERLIDSHESQIDAVRGAQKCIIGVLLIHPDERQERNLAVEEILEACPDALDTDNIGSISSELMPVWNGR